ncbi:MAG: cell division protein ZapA [Bacteroidetes bacterium]|nr:cell division protein ZapA [Bacteroidota bacterium]MBS1685697.1 cell division protein ZapA [Bacteroidota bacterium]
MENTVQVNVTVADRIYPLRVSESEKEEVLDAVKLVNEKVREYQRLYDGKDKQDYLAMVLLLFAVEHMRNAKKIIIEDSSFDTKLAELEQILSQA